MHYVVNYSDWKSVNLFSFGWGEGVHSLNLDMLLRDQTVYTDIVSAIVITHINILLTVIGLLPKCEQENITLHNSSFIV